MDDSFLLARSQGHRAEGAGWGYRAEPWSPCDGAHALRLIRGVGCKHFHRRATSPHAEMSLSKTWEIRVRSVSLYQCQNPGCDIVPRVWQDVTTGGDQAGGKMELSE